MPRKTESSELQAAMKVFNETGNASCASRITGVSKSVIYRELDRLGVDRGAHALKDRRHYHSKTTTAQDEEIVRRYSAGEAASALSEEFGVTPATIRLIARNGGATINRKGQKPTRLNDGQIAKIKTLLAEGLSQASVSRELGLKQSTLSCWLRSGVFGYVPRNTKKRAGGVIKNTDGYVLIHKDLVDPEFQCMANGTGYVLEHRLNLARQLKRPLQQSETVHHKDGNKQNNHTDNLELRRGPHGKHARFVCACCGSNDIIAVALGQ